MSFSKAELVPGDIIFFKNLYKNGDGGYDYEYIDHVAMFVKYENETPMIVHSITSPKGHYHPTKLSGLCITTLRALKNQIQEEDDKRYDVKYEVFRSKYSDIAAKALEIILKQVQYRIPYDEKRLNAKLELEANLEGKDFAKMGMDAYRKEGIYRSIKYAARYPHPLTRTRKNGVGRGLTCSMSIILAYQIAELLLADKIKPIDLNTEWPSDKYASSEEKPSQGCPVTYDAYQKKLTNNAPISSRVGLRSSLHFWKGQTSPEDYQHQTFAIDAKVTGAEGMHLYMQEHNMAAWKYLGDYEAPEISFSAKDKELHKKQLSISHSDFLTQIATTVHQFPLLCSASGSEAPVTVDLKENWWGTKTEMKAKNMEKSNLSQITEDVLKKIQYTATIIAESRFLEASISPHFFANLMSVFFLLLDRENIKYAMQAFQVLIIMYELIPYIQHFLTDKKNQSCQRYF